MPYSSHPNPTERTPPPSAPRRRGRPPSPARDTRRQRLERAGNHYLRDCYNRRTPARSDDFARHLGLTPQYLARVTWEAFGMSPRDFLRVRQLRYAEHLLVTTSLSTIEIAALSGFGTPPTFYRAFKAVHGLTPGTYRKRVRE